MRENHLQAKYGYTQQVAQALSLIKTNKIRLDDRGEDSLCKMIAMLFSQRHRLGIDHTIKRFRILKQALTIIKKEKKQ